MSNLVKPQNGASDANSALSAAYNDVDKTISVNGFLVSKVGAKVVRTLTDPTIETYSFYDNSTLLYTITVTYTDSTLGTIAQVERTA